MNTTNSNRLDILLQTKIDSLLSEAKSEMVNLRKELKTYHGGTLYIKRYKAYTIFTEYYSGKEKSIGKNIKRIHMLARRKYILSLLKCIESNYMFLKKLSRDIKICNYTNKIDSLLNSYISSGLDMDKILFSRHQQQWLNQPYERNPAYPEELKFKTTNDKLMRTKSELLIANRLEHYNIPYLPEMPLWFSYNLRPKYPDFTILKHDGSTIIWEHMGRMDKEDYFIKNSRKIIEYRQNGYSQNTNLIITFEEDIREPGMIDHIIESRLLI